MHLREMMLPEKSIRFPMDRDYVLAALETSIYQAFPAPIKIDPPLMFILNIILIVKFEAIFKRIK